MKRNFRKIKKNGGAAMLVTVIFFLSISLAIISGLVSPTIQIFRNTNVNLNSKRSYFLAESGSEDAMYRIIKGKTIGSEEVISLDGNSSITTITTNGNNEKQINSTGDISDYQRKVGLTLRTGAGVAFNYGIQTGTGGFTMDGGSKITGNVYSNSNINATTGVQITGTAVAASNAALVADQTNDTPVPSSSMIKFRDLSASQDFAQSFQVSSDAQVYKIQLYIKKFGSPSNANIYIVSDSNGSPSTTKINIGTVTLNSNQVTTNFGWLELLLPTQPSLTPGATYWIVVDNSSQNTNNYYIMGANNLYTSGVAKTGAYNGAWNATNLDGYFRIYLMQGVTSLIGGDTWVGGVNIGIGTVGDAWATIVKGGNVAGAIYCQVGYYNNKSCDTSRGAPPPEPMPYSEANIQSWKDEGAAGGVIANPIGSTASTCRTNKNCPCPGNSSSDNSAKNCVVNDVGATFGPGEVVGDLTVNGGGTLYVTGTVWVHGKITVSGGANVKLPIDFSQYSATLISDGKVLLNGGSYTGSGADGSYLFVVSTSSASDAITVSGGSGTIAVNAQSGGVTLNGGIHINAAVGNSIRLTGGANVSYEDGLASPIFMSGPSGAWIVGSWQETQ